jgi:hypothetical protein
LKVEFVGGVNVGHGIILVLFLSDDLVFSTFKENLIHEDEAALFPVGLICGGFRIIDKILVKFDAGSKEMVVVVWFNFHGFILVLFLPKEIHDIGDNHAPEIATA